jgi:hypothetical protein
MKLEATEGFFPLERSSLPSRDNVSRGDFGDKLNKLCIKDSLVVIEFFSHSFTPDNREMKQRILLLYLLVHSLLRLSLIFFSALLSFAPLYSPGY